MRFDLIDLLRRAGNTVEEEVPLRNPETGKDWRIDVVVNASRSGIMDSGWHFAIEIDGYGLSHVGRKGWHRDRDKGNAITIAGYRLLRFTWEQIGNGDALEILARCGVNVEDRSSGSGRGPREPAPSPSPGLGSEPGGERRDRNRNQRPIPG